MPAVVPGTSDDATRNCAAAAGAAATKGAAHQLAHKCCSPYLAHVRVAILQTALARMPWTSPGKRCV